MSRKQIEHAATEFTKEMFPNINFTDYCLWPMVAVITQKRYNRKFLVSVSARKSMTKRISQI